MKIKITHYYRYALIHIIIELSDSSIGVVEHWFVYLILKAVTF